MLKEDNELLTQTGPGTPGGEMMRRYWLPAALSEELPPGGAPLPVRMLSEDLVLFRVDEGPGARGQGPGLASTPTPDPRSQTPARYGLLGLHCAHRGADLSYGRLEDGGLRCLYHGWLYDVQGNCLEQPGEPEGSSFYQKIKHRAYPCHEVAGIIFAYLGPGEPPLFPNYELFRVPADHRQFEKLYQECNYLQASEGNIDSIHIRLLHSLLPGGRYSSSWGARGQRGGTRPRCAPECEDTHFGVRVFHSYQEADGPHVNINNFILPSACAVNGSMPAGDGYDVHWHVPIDDTHHWRYGMIFRRSAPIGQGHDRSQEGEPVADQNYRLFRNKANRYRQDREEQKADSYAGLGPNFPVHDAFATATAGEISDRTQEHLPPTDSGIVALRERMLRAIKDVQEGRDPPHVLRHPDEQDRLLEIFATSERVPEGTTLKAYRAQRDGHPLVEESPVPMR